jgi:hypothetical protein
MKKLIIMVSGLILSSAVLAEKIQWYSGAFEESGSGKKTTSSNVVGKEADATKYVFGFASDKSNMAFAQFPLQARPEKNALSFEAMSKKSKVNAEVWVETKGWKFQGKITIPADKFSKIVLPLKECKSDEVKWLRVVIPNKANPQRGMLLLKNPELSQIKMVETRTWYTGAFKAKVKSSCTQSPDADGAVKYSWKFDGPKAGPTSFSTAFKSKDKCREFEFKLQNLTDNPVTLQIYIETPEGWKFQKKIKITGKEWELKKFKLIDADSTKTKYFRFIIAPNENAMTGAFRVKNLKYVK